MGRVQLEWQDVRDDALAAAAAATLVGYAACAVLGLRPKAT